MWQPAQGELLRVFGFGFLENNRDASEALWLVKDQPNRLDTRLRRTPASLILYLAARAQFQSEKRCRRRLFRPMQCFPSRATPCSAGGLCNGRAIIRLRI
jgi:hypothetical protein